MENRRLEWDRHMARPALQKYTCACDGTLEGSSVDIEQDGEKELHVA